MKQPEQRSDAWFSARVGRITGSRVGAILGLNPYQKDTDVMRDMVREAFGAEREFTGNDATQWGQDHESEALAEYQFITDNWVESTGLVVHPTYNWLAASPDGLIDDDGVLEIKAPYRGLKRRIEPYYEAQMQLEMHCTNRNWCDFFEWSLDETWLDRVYAKPGWVISHWETLREFIDEYNEIIADESRYSQYLEPVVLERNDNEWQQAVDEYIAADEAVRAANERKTDARSRLIELAGERPTQGAGIKLNKVETKGSIDWAKLAKDQGLDGEQYRKPVKETWRITRSDK